MNDLDTSVVVTMIIVRVMQVVSHQIIQVISMRYPLMAAVCAVGMTGSVTFASVFRSTTVGILLIHFQSGIIEVIAVFHVQVAIMQVTGSVAALKSGMAAVGAVGVLMSLMALFTFHKLLLDFQIEMSKVTKLLAGKFKNL